MVTPGAELSRRVRDWDAVRPEKVEVELVIPGTEHLPQLDPGLARRYWDHARLKRGPHVHNGNGTLDLTGKWPVGSPHHDVKAVTERRPQIFVPRAIVIPGFVM